ncbi:MAG: alternative ribosome rescue aminoacyl-tRNA hydrolase ArfB [Myxococcota bacterium]
MGEVVCTRGMSRGDLEVQRRLAIPAGEITERASRAGGPGGQHVNKTSTRVTLRWSVLESQTLSDSQRARLLAALGPRLNREGELIVHARRFRSRSRNRQLARERLAELVRGALAVRRRRVPTGPSRSSKERGLAAKKRRGAVKRTRSRVRVDDE